MEQSVNERIKLLRNKLGLSQNEFASKVGMSSPGVWKLENGDSKPRTATLTTICTAFGIDIEWLKNGKGTLVFGDLETNKNISIGSTAEAWKSKAEHLEKEVIFYRELLLNVTSKASANFLEAFDIVGFLPEKVVESVRVAA